MVKMRLIDADEAIERIEKEIEKENAKIYEWESNRKDREGYYDVDAKIKQCRRNITYCKADITGLRSCPTVDAQPVRYGKWIKVSEFMPIYCCSECKERNLFDSNGNNVLSDYCPKCGARMDDD